MALRFLVMLSFFVALATPTPQQKTTAGWVTIPAFCDKTTTPRAPIIPVLPPGDQIALDLINSFRSSHQNTPRLSYNTTLAQMAVNCANQFASVGGFNLDSYNGMCQFPTLGTAVAFTPSTNQLDAIRYAISDSTQQVFDNTAPTPLRRLVEPFGWFAGYEQIIGIDPFLSRPYQDVPGLDDTLMLAMPRDIRARPYIQMIWASATQTGCGYSNRVTTYLSKYTTDPPATADYRVVICLFDVVALYGDYQQQLANIRPRIITP